MGYIKHNSIIVSSWDDEKLLLAHKKAQETFGSLTTLIHEYIINSGGSFAVLPDGSKEGWTESDAMDEKRKDFIKFLDEQAYDDGSNSLYFVDVWFDEEAKRGISKTQ